MKEWRLTAAARRRDRRRHGADRARRHLLRAHACDRRRRPGPRGQGASAADARHRRARAISSRPGGGRAGSRSTASATSSAPTRGATATSRGARGAGAARRCGAGSRSTSATTSTSAASASAPRPATSIAGGCGATARRRASATGTCAPSSSPTASPTRSPTCAPPTRRAACTSCAATCSGSRACPQKTGERTHDRQRGPGPLDLRGAHRLRHRRVPAPARRAGSTARRHRVGRTPQSTGSSGCAPTGIVALMPARYWVETLGCPKNQVDSDKLVGTLEADGSRRRRRCAEDADLVVVNTCAFIEAARQESIDTVLALERGAPARRAPRRHRLPGRALRRRAGRPRCRRPTRSPGFGVPVTLTPKVPSFDLLNLPRPRSRGALGLREGGRGLRPHVRVLRHPVVPGQAALAVGRLDPRRGRAARAWRRSCSSPRTSRRTDATSGTRRAHRAARAGSGGARVAAHAAALPLSERARRRAGRRGVRRPACRTSTSRCSTCPSRCCGACAGGATASASCAASARSAPASPRPRSVRRSSWATRARPRTTTTCCCASSRRPTSTGPGSSRSRARTGTYAAGLDGAVDERPGRRAAPRARPSCRTASPRAGVTHWWARGRCPRGHARRRSHAPRGARDRRHRGGPRDAGARLVRPPHGHRRRSGPTWRRRSRGDQLRAVGAGHAGQRRHAWRGWRRRRSCWPSCSRRATDGSWLAVGVWFVLVVHRRRRRLARPAHGTTRPARSSIRSRTRSSCSARWPRSWSTTCSGGCRWR